MALNFGILSQVPSFGQQFAAGQQAAQAQQERNMLRQAQAEQTQFQRENMLAQRDERLAIAQERKARDARAAQRQQFLNGAAEALAQGGQKLDRPTLTKVLQSGIQADEPSLVQFAREGLKALDEEELYQRESARLGLGGAAPAAAEPTNALATPPAAAPGSRFTREQAQEMILSTNPRIREQGKALVGTLEKTQPSRLADKFVPVGKLVFDRETGQFITPPAAAIAATQERGAAAPAKEPAAKPLTAAQEAARRDKLGKEFKSASSALQTTQDVLDSIAAVVSAPGLSRATGYSGTMLPSFPEGEAAQAETRLANLKGKVTALGKAAAAASGAIGSIANQEWKILADQIAAIDPVKGKGPLLEQIGLVEAQALGAMERIQDAYNRQFGEDFERFPQFKDLPPPKSTQPKGRKSGGAVTPAGAAPAPATGALSPAEQAELEQLRKLLRKGG
jgi:hypothetical protein